MAPLTDLAETAAKAGFFVKTVETARDPYYVLIRQSDGRVMARAGDAEMIRRAIGYAPREWEPPGYEDI